jgi:hypothetical protein
MRFSAIFEEFSHKNLIFLISVLVLRKQMSGGGRYAAFCHCINHVAILVQQIFFKLFIEKNVLNFFLKFFELFF